MPAATTRSSRRAQYELGEGRSKSIYIAPEVEDTAVLLAFYNPVPFKRILKNIRYIMKCLREVGIPYFVAECVFEGRRPQLPDADLHVRSKSFMFYKEQLLNLLEKKVPAKYTKLVFLDADILFDAPDWLNQISVKLDVVDVLQPFQEACWLTPDNTRIRNKKYSYGYAIVNKLAGRPGELHAYHPGFAWAMRRSVFKALGGFYPRSIVGNGDMMFTLNFFVDAVPEVFRRDHNVPDSIVEGWETYHARFKAVGPSVGFLALKALHLFHGLTEQRQYKTRYKDVGDYLKGSWLDIVETNADGLMEFRGPAAAEASAAVLDYFRRRNEDIPLKEAIAALAASRGRGLTRKALDVAATPQLNMGEEVPAGAAAATQEN
jgi:hypothetical protein